MTTSEKAVEVLKTKYGIDARIYEDNVYLSVWNDELSDTIDAEASSKQVLEWASEYVSPNKIGSLEYWKHKCKVKELECDWLDALANYERDGDGDDRDEIDELYDESEKERKLFNELYNAGIN